MNLNQNNREINANLDAEIELLRQIRAKLSGELSGQFQLSSQYSFKFEPKISRVYISLFQSGQKSIRFGSTKKTLADTLERIVYKLKQNNRFNDFAVEHPELCRILFEIVVEETSCDINRLKHSASGKNQFDPGLHGLKFSLPGKIGYFMPSDAVVKNIQAVKDVILYLSRRTYIADKTRKKSERIELMKSEPIQFSRIRSAAFITYQNEVFPLFRGYPLPLPTFNRDYLYHSILDANSWLVNHLDENGKFVYFYDPVSDSNTDIDHPKNPHYYNMLRHAGAIISLLQAYELSKQQNYLQSAERAIQYLLETFQDEWINNDDGNKEYICYPMCNRKAKLGGAGIALVALVKYSQWGATEKIDKAMDGLVNHLLSRIDENGEFLTYYIHPNFNHGQPMLNMDDKTKKLLFSFYYPGEAMLGIALYYRYRRSLPKEKEQLLLNKSRLAMDFLIEKRPQKYPELFNRVPDDAWLMQAVEEWVKVDGFDKQSYYDFLYQDATAIIKYMRSREDSPLINIGARSEGVIAAFYAAKARGDNEKADYFISNIIQSVKGLRKTQHTEKSAYAHLYPDKSIGSFSFRMTSQWIRIDSIQHTASLLVRLYQSDEVQ